MFISKDKSLLTILLMILLVNDLNFEKLVKCCFYSNLVMYLIFIIGASLGFIPNWTYTRGETIRYSYGYCYPSLTSTYLFLLFLMRFFLKKGKVETFEIALQIIAAVLIYQVTDSRMGFALSCMIIIAEIIIKIFYFFKSTYVIKLNGFIKKSFIVFPILAVTIMSILTFSYSKGSNIGISANKVLSSRLKYTQQAIEEYGISMFGKDID